MSRRLLVGSVAVSLLALLLVAGSATATPGALDPGFGSGGTVTTAIATGGSDAYALALQPDGKILAGGQTSSGSESEFALARYNADGALDTSFGTGGTVSTAIGSSFDGIHALALQPTDGKILAAGSSYDGSEYEFALARYNADGSLDTSFGTGGKVVTLIGASSGEAYAIALQTDGKIVVGGSSGGNFVIARYNADGSLDTSFGSSGIVTTAVGYLTALALQSDGKIVAVGSLGSSEFALARYNTNGALDTSFGTGGTVVMTPSGTAGGVAYALVIQPDGKIVVAGETDLNLFPPPTAAALVRFNADGSLDTSFGQGGTVTTLSGSNSSGRALALQPDGKLVLAGYTGEGSTAEFLVARYNANGTQDTSFDGGIVTTPIGTNASVAEALVLQPDGKIVAGGYTTSGTNDVSSDEFAIARYLVTSTLTVSKTGHGSGSVTSNPAGIDCGSTCSAPFAAAVPVTMTATPATGSVFTGWSGAGCSGTGSCQVQMSSDQSVTATFSLAPETLYISRLGTGSGKVSSSPAGIDCGYACWHDYPYGTTVTLSANPAKYSKFAGWSGACSGVGTCTLKLTGVRSVNAVFKHKRMCIVPRVKHKALKVARRKIKRAHCRTGKIRHRYSKVKKGHVIKQKPRPRRHLRKGAKVKLVVSKGKRH